MNIVKKNIVFVVTLTVTLIIAGVMFFFVVKATNKMKTSLDKVEKLRKQINELNEKSPAPLQENLDKITNDYTFMAKKVEELHPIFGVPYPNAIKVFAEKLGLSVKELKEKWRKIYRKEIKKGGDRELIFVNFFSQFDSEKLNSAKLGFQNTVNKKSIEPINETNINNAIMEALGLPVKLDEISCTNYIKNMQRGIVDYMKTADKDGEIPFTFKDAVTEKLSFERYDNAMPRPDEIPLIFKHWRMLEDMFKRLKSSKISHMESIKRDNLLKGSILFRKYQVFSYTIEIRGSLNSIRTFMNSMMDAYKDNKVYIIRSLSLKANDEASSILSGKKERAVRKPLRYLRGRRKVEEKPKEPEKIKVNVPIIGVSNIVTATITFDYVIFIGNEIKK